MARKIATAMTAVALFSIISGKGAMSMDLRQFQWKSRLLFLFAPDRNDLSFNGLKNEISARKREMADRDLFVFEVLESGESFLGTKTLKTEDAMTLRKRFDVSPESFTVVLVGKDGGVKLNRNTRVSLQDVFDLIDAMPMRQEEMRQKARKP